MIQLLAPPMTLDLTDFVRAHQRDLWRYARALGAVAARADELVQDAFVLTWRKAAPCGEHARDAAFLRKLVRDGWIDGLRRDRRARAALAEAEHDAAEVEASWQQAPDSDRWLDALADCKATLAGKAAAAVEAFYDRDLGRAGAAAAVGLSENGLKTLLQRTRAVLRDCVRRRLHEEDAR